MGLRTVEGVSIARLEAEGDGPFDALVDQAGLARLERHGLTIRTPDRLAATAAGRQRLGAVLGHLIAEQPSRTAL